MDHKAILRLVTVSSARAYGKCARKYKHAYLDRRRPKVDALALSFGTAIHRALELRGLGKPHEECIDGIRSLSDEYERARGFAMFDGYCEFWRDDGLTFEAVEQKFRLPLVNPLTGRVSRTAELGGKIDGLVRASSGVLWLIEHKTTSDGLETDSAYWRKLRIDSQVSVYLHAHPECFGVIYDVLRKPQIQKKQIALLDSDGLKQYVDEKGVRALTLKGAPRQSGAEGLTLLSRDETPHEFYKRCIELIAAEPNKFYARCEVFRDTTEEADAISDVWQISQNIGQAIQMGRFPRNADSCFTYGRPCEYFDVCTGMVSIADDTLFKTVDEHPELSEAKV